MKTANEVIFRASMIGSIMPSDSPRVNFTDTHISNMIKIFNYSVYGIKEEIKSKYLEKGNEREEDSITLLSRVTKKYYRKNTERKSNSFITGEWDLDDEENGKTTETLDIKTSWNKNTFDESRVKKLNSDYYWQGVTYMELTGAERHHIVRCLVNGTASRIMDEKRYLAIKLGVIDTQNKAEYPIYIEQCKQIERNHIIDLKHFKDENPWFDFDNELSAWDFDLPLHKRVDIKTIERDPQPALKMYLRIKECREWMLENLF